MKQSVYFTYFFAKVNPVISFEMSIDESSECTQRQASIFRFDVPLLLRLQADIVMCGINLLLFCWDTGILRRPVPSMASHFSHLPSGAFLVFSDDFHKQKQSKNLQIAFYILLFLICQFVELSCV